MTMPMWSRCIRARTTVAMVTWLMHAAQRPVHVSRVDLRVGLITTARKHPDADALYVEDILCGEEAPRVVVSGLVKHIPEPEMQQRLVVVVANLKPANLKGVKSHAMVLAATGADGKVRAAAP
jgi:methionine--tRNA ligase beta chain